MANIGLQGGSEKPELTTQLQLQDRGILPRIGHQIVVFYDWLSGPPLTEHERMIREIAAEESIRLLDRHCY